MLSSDEDSPSFHLNSLKQNLPQGVKILKTRTWNRESQRVTQFDCKFDHVSKLDLLEFPYLKRSEQLNHPFEGVKIVDEGRTLLFSAFIHNPLQDLKDRDDKEIDQVYKGYRLSLKLKTPFQVVESNASRISDQILSWEYDLQALKKLPKEEEARGGMWARFRK